jgi:dolichol-phosphate mannosyltransferase
VSKNLVIIPTYNEKENIEGILNSILTLPVGFDILVIDDNSPDQTATLVKNLQAKFSERIHLIEREGKMGLGTAYITGFNWALDRNYDLVFEMDADFSHNPDDLIKLYHACQDEGADLAIGSRYITGVNVINWPLGRVIMSYFASVYVRFITGMRIKDTTAGFKCYKNIVLQTIEFDRIRSKGYAFQIEMKFTAWKYGFRLKEVPIVFTDRKLGNSKMSGGIFNEALWGVIAMKVRSWFRKYKNPIA